MGYTILKDIDVGKEPVMFAAWPGVGNVGYIAAEFLIRNTNSTEFAKINSSEYFYPSSAIIQNNVLKSIYFPQNSFYYARYQEKNFIFFLGEQQLPIIHNLPTEQNPAYKLAKDAVDLAEQFGCKTIYTSGAIFSMLHHSMTPGVTWGANTPEMAERLNRLLAKNFRLQDTFQPMISFITGMNGILPAVAKDRNLQAAALLGEVPIYLQPIQIAYPKASASILQAFAFLQGITLPLEKFTEIINSTQTKIDEIMGKFKASLPPKMKKDIFSEIEQLKQTKDSTSADVKLTYEDVKNAISEIEQFFKKENNNG